MAFVAVRAAPGLRAAAPTKSGKSSRPSAGAPTITARCRPVFCQPPRAFYRTNGVWDDDAADAMRVSAVVAATCCCCLLLLWISSMHAYAWMQHVHATPVFGASQHVLLLATIDQSSGLSLGSYQLLSWQLQQRSPCQGSVYPAYPASLVGQLACMDACVSCSTIYRLQFCCSSTQHSGQPLYMQLHPLVNMYLLCMHAVVERIMMLLCCCVLRLTLPWHAVV
jgi:hypothetical protein